MNFTEFLSHIPAPFTNQDNHYHRVLYAQALLESGRFSSRGFTEGNNMFGMKPAQTRTKFYIDTIVLREGKFAKYAKLSDAFLDRFDLDNYNGLNTNLENDEDVLTYISNVYSKGYAQDPKYISKVWDIYKSEFGDGNPQPEQTFNDDDEGSTTWNIIKKVSLVLSIIGSLWIGYKWTKRKLNF